MVSCFRSSVLFLLRRTVHYVSWRRELKIPMQEFMDIILAHGGSATASTMYTAFSHTPPDVLQTGELHTTPWIRAKTIVGLEICVLEAIADVFDRL